MRIIFLILLFPVFAFAGLEDDLKNFFNRMGFDGTSTQPGAYHDQAAGYYSGGGFSVRNKSRNAQLATLQLPTMSMGCGGIDLYTGGFSFIKTDRLVQALKDIGSSTASYAFMLAIQTVSPQIYNLLGELNSLANKINAMNINSCETAATMLGGVWPRGDQTSKSLCSAMGTNSGTFSDYAAARQGCGKEGRRDEVINAGKTKPEFEDLMVGEYNLAWKAIQKNAFLASDQALAEMFMSISGTIINTKDNKPKIISAKVLDGNLLSALLNGGDVTIYACDTKEKCLNPIEKKITISPKESFLGKVQATLNKILENTYEDTALTKEEIAFLNAVRLPLYKMVGIEAMHSKAGKGEYLLLRLGAHADLFALDILFKYLEECLDIVSSSTDFLQQKQFSADQIEKFLQGLRDARIALYSTRNNALQKMVQTQDLIQKTKMIEQYFWSLSQ